jgi:hypothetical protein
MPVDKLCNYDLSKFPFITNCQVVYMLFKVIQVWLFENGPSRSGVNRYNQQTQGQKVTFVDNVLEFVVYMPE